MSISSKVCICVSVWVCGCVGAHATCMRVCAYGGVCVCVRPSVLLYKIVFHF